MGFQFLGNPDETLISYNSIKCAFVTITIWKEERKGSENVPQQDARILGTLDANKVKTTAWTKPW